jgi:hypothetical protein
LFWVEQVTRGAGLSDFGKFFFETFSIFFLDGARFVIPPLDKGCMDDVAIWDEVNIPIIVPEGWSRPDVHYALGSLERISRRVEAARAVLIGSLGVSERDTASVVARHGGVSVRKARSLVNVAGVVERVPGALDAIARGDVGVEHLSSLRAVDDVDVAAELVVVAANESPEDFAKTVQRRLVDDDPAKLRDKQKASRSVSFYRTKYGCVGMRAVFTPLEGEEFKNRLSQIVDAQWRKDHPKRARVLGGHVDATYEQRMADALIGLGKAKPAIGDPGSKTVVLVNVKLETLQAELVGHGPIGLDELNECLARADVYAVITGLNEIPIRFGRSKRLATSMQKLLLAAAGGGTCSYPGCDRHWTHTKVHHVRRFEAGGLTDIENLALLCDQHHRHHHIVDERGIDRPLRIIVGVILGRGPPVGE